MALFSEGSRSSLGLTHSPKLVKPKLNLRLSPRLYPLSDRQSTKPSTLPSISHSPGLDDLHSSPRSLTDRLYPDWLESRKDFQDLRSRYERLSSLDVFQICKKPGPLRCDFERMAVVRIIEKCPFFSSLKGTQLIELTDRMTSREFAMGEVLMHVGDAADCLYLILQGKVGIYTDDNRLLDEVTSGNVIGESAIQNKTGRTATVKAHCDIQTLILTYDDFDNMAFQVKLRDFYDVANFLASIDYFSDWSLSKLYRLASVSIIKQYHKSQIIYSKGEFARDLYIVKQGEIHLQLDLDINQANKWPTAANQWTCLHTTKRYRQTVRTCKAGSIFGEQELIDNQPLAFTAVCVNKAVLCIVRDQFFGEIFSEKDRRKLYNLTERPETKEIRYELEFERQKEKILNSALLDAINTNPVPVGRSLHDLHGEEKRQLWARNLIKREKLREKKGVIRKTQVVETIRSGSLSP